MFFGLNGSKFTLRVTRVIRTRSNGAISALFGLSSLEYRRIPASSAPKISANFIRLSPIGFSDEQIVVPARQSPQVLLYVTARGLTKQERRDAVRKRGSDNSRYPRRKAFFLPLFIEPLRRQIRVLSSRRRIPRHCPCIQEYSYLPY